MVSFSIYRKDASYVAIPPSPYISDVPSVLVHRWITVFAVTRKDGKEGF